MKSACLILILSSVFLIQCVQKAPIKNQNNGDIKNNRIPASIKKRDIASYPKCNANNNYLENQLSKMPGDLFEQHENYWDKYLPIDCVRLAQNNYQGYYGLCDSEYAKPKISHIKPCLSEKYTRLVYNAYNDVKNCFNLDPKSSFLQIMIESGFHVNAINKTGFDAGIAQFTKNGLSRIQSRDLIEKTSRLLLESTNPSCSRISSVLKDIQKDSFGVKNRCGMIALPSNPYRGFVYKFLHALRDQMDLKRLLDDRKDIQPFVNDQFLDQMVYFAYNRGITGSLKLLDGYMQNRKRAGAVLTAHDFDLWKNLSLARKILKQEPYKRELLKKEIIKIKKLTFAEYAVIHNQNYLATMSEAKDFVEARLGQTCF